MTNITPISKINNRNMETVIDFLTTITKDTVRNIEVGGGVLLSTPQQYLYPDANVNHVHGFVTGVILARIENIRDSLIALKDKNIEMNSLSAEMFKQFCEDLKEGKPFIVLSIPFTTETVTMNFVMLQGASRWTLMNIWSNEVNLFQYAIERFMAMKQFNSCDLFATDQITEQQLRHPEKVDVLTLVRAINNENNQYSEKQRDEAVTMYRQLVTGHNVKEQEYPVQVIYHIGLLGNGCDLPVKLECQSHHHKDVRIDANSYAKYTVLPYSLKDGSSNMLLCHSCSAKEQADILHTHPEWHVE